jgi:hypothetical protein
MHPNSSNQKCCTHTPQMHTKAPACSVGVHLHPRTEYVRFKALSSLIELTNDVEELAGI